MKRITILVDDQAASEYHAALVRDLADMQTMFYGHPATILAVEDVECVDGES